MAEPTLINQVLLAFKAVAMESGFARHDAHVGVIRPDQVRRTPKCYIFLADGQHFFVDGEMDVDLKITTVVTFVPDAHDPARAESEHLQAIAAYCALMVAIETAFATRGQSATPFSGLGRLIIEHDSGISSDGYDDQGELVRIGETWRVQASRDEGSAS